MLDARSSPLTFYFYNNKQHNQLSKMSPPDVQSLSIYHYNGPKVLVQPCTLAEAEKVLRHKAARKNHHLAKAQRTDREGKAVRLKFLNYALWYDRHSAGVISRQVFLDLVQAIMHQNQMQLLCCADLNLTGTSAGTLFFQHNPDQTQEAVDVACIQLGYYDKLRIVRFPSDELPGLERVINQAWNSKYRSVEQSNKYGIKGFKLKGGSPWFCHETSNTVHMAGQQVILQMMAYMYENGWTRVVPFDCSTSDFDADSLLIFRDQLRMESPAPSSTQQFCAIALERSHKLRLLLTDRKGSSPLDGNKTLDSFEAAVRRHWKGGIAETNTHGTSRQMKCRGSPWYPNTTEENIASAKLICGILQDLWALGWRWHCAVDLSTSVSDKSTFILRRSFPSEEDGLEQGRIGCLQPKGHGKVNLVSFPPDLLSLVISKIQAHNWCAPLMKVESHGRSCATIHFRCANLHYAHQTAQKLRTERIYTDLLSIVATAAGSNNNVTMMGCADISARFVSGGEHSPPRSLDTDAFFFVFT